MPLRLIVTYGNYGKSPLTEQEKDLPMGGCKSALLALSTELARRGHDVHVFAEGAPRVQRDGVYFYDRGEFACFCRTYLPDVLIIIPEMLPLLLPVRARARVVWTGNASRQGDYGLVAPWVWEKDLGRNGEYARLYSTALLWPYADRFVVKSQWQAGNMSKKFGIPPSKFTVAYNGVPLEYYQGPAPARHRYRLVYASQARRGLGPLLRLFPQLRAAVPEVELHIFGYEFDDSETLRKVQAGFPEASQPGICWRGCLSKSALARELRSAAIMAYPCTFPETFCTAVAEAQAAGLPVVTSTKGSLAERVSNGVDGFLIPGTPETSPEYEGAFVKAVVRLLKDEDLWTQMGREAAKKAERIHSWDVVAAGWEEELTRLVAGREPLPPRLEPGLNLLDPSLLTVEEKGGSVQVPEALARDWLRTAWASYGYGPETIPVLPRENAKLEVAVP
jgi:glycosyltransferase involved in cell wall biosynthesis